MGDEWNNINSRASGQQAGRKSFQDRWEKLIKEANPKLAEKNLKPFKDAITPQRGPAHRAVPQARQG